MLQRYVTTLGDLRMKLQTGIKTIKRTVTDNGTTYSSDLAVPGVPDLETKLAEMSVMQDHAALLGAANAPQLGSLAAFVAQLCRDIEAQAREVKQIQETAEADPDQVHSYIRQTVTGGGRRRRRGGGRTPRTPRRK